MALPNPIQKLKHGVLLCKKNFMTFVETFNFLIDFVQNLRGDGDGNGNGLIVFDRSIPDRPIIRAKKNFDHYTPSGAAYEPDPSPFCIEHSVDSGGNPVTKIVNNTFYFDGVPKTVSDYTVPSATLQGGTVYLNGTSSVILTGWTFTLGTSPLTPTSQTRVLNHKLYDFSGGAVSMDYRTTFLSVSSGVTGIYGSDNGSGGDSEVIYGEFQCSGREGSGLTVSTKKADGMQIDLVGRDHEEDEFAVHTLSDSHNLPLCKFLSTGNVMLPAGGGSITADTSFTVITAIRYDTSTGYIQIKTRTAMVVNGVVTEFTSETDWQNAIATTPLSQS